MWEHDFFIIFYCFLGENYIIWQIYGWKKVPSYLLLEGRLSVFLYFLYSSHNTPKEDNQVDFAWEEKGSKKH